MNAFYGALIGAVGAWLVAALVRLWGIPQEVREHDRLVADLDDDLALWVADEKVRVDGTVKRTTEEMAASGMLRSGETNYLLATARQDALQTYRHQTRMTKQKVAEIRDRERWRHLLVRRVHPRLGAFPELTTLGKAKPVLDQWRLAAALQTPPREIDDPTARTLDTVLAELDAASA